MTYSTKNTFPLLLFIAFIVFEVCIFLLNKVTSISASGSGIGYYINILKEPWIWITLGLSILQLFLWTSLLSQSELSLVYSLSSVSYPITMLIAKFMFNEHLPVLVWIGGITISLGVLLIGINTDKASLNNVEDYNKSIRLE